VRGAKGKKMENSQLAKTEVSGLRKGKTSKKYTDGDHPGKAGRRKKKGSMARPVKKKKKWGQRGYWTMVGTPGTKLGFFVKKGNKKGSEGGGS